MSTENDTSPQKHSPELGTVYVVRSKNTSVEFVFHYDLNGVLTSFNINEALSDEQAQWLFQPSVFPYAEYRMKEWTQKGQQAFIFRRYTTDFTFENLWELYNYKVAKQDAQKAFKKLKEEEKIKCFMGVHPYNMYLQRTKIAKAHLSRYINGRYFENEYP